MTPLGCTRSGKPRKRVSRISNGFDAGRVRFSRLLPMSAFIPPAVSAR